MTTTTIANAVKAGNLDELWDSTANEFSGAVLEDLEEKLFGDDDPVTYIKANDTEYSTTGSYVVPASTLNAKVGDATYGLILKLGGMEWMATSLTLADLPDGTTDNVILTLYLSSPYKTNSVFYTSESTAKGNNMYSASTIRSNLLSWSDFNLFSDGSTTDSFASKYLVQPKNINYQQNETAVGRDASITTHYPNEALGALSSDWASGINYQPSDEIRGERYDAWGEDYIWLPSITETGISNLLNTGCIWKLSNEQRKFTGGTGYAYWRSGYRDNYKYAHMMESAGTANGSMITARGVRPAIHLNLTAAAAASTGGTIKNTTADTTTKTYQNAAYTFSVNGIKPTKMDLTLSGNITNWDATTRSFTATDVGEYKVTVALKPSIVALGREWAGGGTASAEYTFKIEEATPEVTAVLKASGDLYTTQSMPPLILSTDTTAIADANAANKPYILVTANCEGTVSWDNDPKPSATVPNYDFTFTPTGDKAGNYTGAVTKSVPLTFVVPKLNDIEVVSNGNTDPVYTKYDATRLRQWFTVNAVYSSGDKEPTPNYTIVLPTGGLVAGSNTLTFRYDDGTNKKNKTATITGVILSEVTRLDVFPDFTGATIYSSASAEDLKQYLDVDAVWNSDDSETLAAADYTVILPAGGLVAPTTNIKVSYNGTESAEIPVPVTAVALASITVESHSCTGDIYPTSTAADINANITVVLKGTNNDGSAYDGGNAITGYTLAPAADFATSGKIDVSYNGITTQFTVSLGTVALDSIALDGGITQSADLYPTSSFADVQAAVSFTLKGTNNDGTAYNGGAAITGYTLALGANFAVDGEVVVTYDGKTTSFNVTLTPVAISGMTATYNVPSGVVVDASCKVDDLKSGLVVVVSYNNGGTVTLAAEGYTLTADAVHGDNLLAAGSRTITVSNGDGTATDTFTVNVDKATHDITGVTLEGNRTAGYDGAAHELTLTGTLPNGVTAAVKYYLNGVEATPDAVGVYDVVVTFTNPDAANYEDIADINTTLEITAATIVDITAVVVDGTALNILNTLDDLKKFVSVTVNYTGNITQTATEFTLTCEGGLLEVGKQIITVTYNDGTQDFTTTVVIEVAKAKVALPVYKGTLSYSGNEIKPTAADFEGFDGALMAFVESKTVAGLNAGAYKAVFALKDSDRYEWATKTTLKKSVFAVVVYDEIVLEDYEAAVEWNLAKAKITATRAEGKLPVFASESFTGSFADIVGLKYYTDEACTEEVAADKLAYSTKYYVKAELLNNENFELDESAMALTRTAFEYTTPEKQLTIWEKIVKFVTVNWLWIVIAVVALILLITIIACAARASKKKREREEQRRLEEKEERKREQEERRLEREERMARMSQQQMMMPQMMPQGMPQSMPQAGGQSMAMSGASSNEILELKAEMAAMRTEATLRAEMAAKESAEIKAVHAAEQQVANLLARLGGDQVVTNGLTLDKLTELVEKTVERVLDRREKAEAPSSTNDGAAAQVPPDAVMTTVTTTKIDTTKKSAQAAQVPAPAGRTIVRNLVAPMPMDDGRVFDVGGFYNPADPVTDDIDNLLGDDNK
ncbi:MAG: hypothetical protein K2H78_00820 [Clostridia bacterium]|nr:hypothetical protein [Clostridia bacterium]